MVKRSKGLRSKSRHILRKKPRYRGFSSITRSLQQFNEGERVNIVIDSAVHHGMPHIRFQGYTGTVQGKQGNAYQVQVRVGKKLKTLVVRPEHMRRG
ncbi:MAG: 50S ribosomal protein L21e [Candidatus Thermoplasmatota archaeon]|nr:50S ribosomal protein L21e [Candidatus Thermoplasmatota archaeon]